MSLKETLKDAWLTLRGYRQIYVEIFPLLSPTPRKVGIVVPKEFTPKEEIEKCMREDLETWVKYLGRHVHYDGEIFRITLTPEGLTLVEDP